MRAPLRRAALGVRPSSRARRLPAGPPVPRQPAGWYDRRGQLRRLCWTRPLAASASPRGHGRYRAARQGLAPAAVPGPSAATTVVRPFSAPADSSRPSDGRQTRAGRDRPDADGDLRPGVEYPAGAPGTAGRLPPPPAATVCRASWSAEQHTVAAARLDAADFPAPLVRARGRGPFGERTEEALLPRRTREQTPAVDRPDSSRQVSVVDGPRAAPGTVADAWRFPCASRPPRGRRCRRGGRRRIGRHVHAGPRSRVQGVVVAGDTGSVPPHADRRGPHRRASPAVPGSARPGGSPRNPALIS